MVVELAFLHPLEAKRVPAQSRVRHKLRLELAVNDRRLPAAETVRAAAPPKSSCRALLF